MDNEPEKLEVKRLAEESCKSNKVEYYVHEQCETKISIKWLRTKLPRSSDSFQIENQEKNDFDTVILKNSSSFDYFILGLWLSTKLTDKMKQALRKPTLKKIINLLETDDWTEVKRIWLLNVCKEVPKLNQHNNLYVKCKRDSRKMFARKMYFLQKYSRKYTCSNIECSNNSVLVNEEHAKFKFHADKDSFIRLNFNMMHAVCRKCDHSNLVTNSFAVKRTPLFLVVENNDKNKIKANQLPKHLIVNKQEYTLLCCDFRIGSQSKAFFYLNDLFYLVDNKMPSIARTTNADKDFVISLYYLS